MKRPGNLPTDDCEVTNLNQDFPVRARALG